MVSHARYPALDRQRIASQSSAIIGNLLRDRMGFRGVVVTDSLEAAAVRGSPERAAVRSMRAGADLILTTGAGSHLRVVRVLTAEARRSRKFRARLTVAAARVLALRSSLRD
jgi:beta-N-acetylhexosaminidase